MLQFETGLFVKNNMIMQQITVEGCIASAEMINNVLKRLPFDASVVQSSCDGKNKETVIFITPPLLTNQCTFVSLDTIQGIAVVIKKVIQLVLFIIPIKKSMNKNLFHVLKLLALVRFNLMVLM